MLISIISLIGIMKYISLINTHIIQYPKHSFQVDVKILLHHLYHVIIRNMCIDVIQLEEIYVL
jgi:hypothetical protein